MACYRKLFRFSLRAFLVVLTIFCVWLGKISLEAHRQKETFKWIKAHGGFVSYQPYETGSSTRSKKSTAVIQWFHNKLGVDYFETVYQVFLVDAELSDISPLANLKHLQRLDLDINYVSDITSLASLADLEYLSLDDNQVSDLSPLKHLTSLEFLSVKRNEIERLDALANLRRMRGLQVNYNYIEEVECLAGLVELTSFTADNNDIRDATPLKQLPKLRMIRLYGNPLVAGKELGD
jgi:hypothetical protein